MWRSVLALVITLGQAALAAGQTFDARPHEQPQATPGTAGRNETSLTLGVPGTQTSLAFADVRMIERPDPTKDGVLKGLLLGGLVMGVTYGVLVPAFSQQEGPDRGLMVLGGTGLGAGVGALHGERSAMSRSPEALQAARA